MSKHKGPPKNETVQAYCLQCWEIQVGPDKPPAVVEHPELEVCCICGALNDSGIYAYRNPDHIPYPREKLKIVREVDE